MMDKYRRDRWGEDSYKDAWPPTKPPTKPYSRGPNRLSSYTEHSHWELAQNALVNCELIMGSLWEGIWECARWNVNNWSIPADKKKLYWKERLTQIFMTEVEIIEFPISLTLFLSYHQN